MLTVIGGDIQKRPPSLIRPGGTLVAIIAIDFVVESDRGQLTKIVQRVRDGRLRTNIGDVASLRRRRRRLDLDRTAHREDDHQRSRP